MTPVKQLWVEWITTRSGGGTLPLVYGSDLPPGALHAWQPEGFELVPEAGSYARADEDGEVVLALRARLISEHLIETGIVDRVLDTRRGIAEHVYFWLPQQVWNQGNARRMIRRAARLYVELGLERVETKAFSIGKYIWARCGFSFASELVAQTTNSALAQFAQDLGLVDEPLPFFAHPWELAVLDLDEDDRPVEISRGVIEEALARRGDRRLPGPPASVGTLAPSKALLIYADYNAWDGVLWLDNRNGGYARLVSYTEGYE